VVLHSCALPADTWSTDSLLNCSVQAEDEVFLEVDNDEVKDREVVEQEWGATYTYAPEQIGELLTATVNVMKDCQAVRHRLTCKRNTVYGTTSCILCAARRIDFMIFRGFAPQLYTTYLP